MKKSCPTNRDSNDCLSRRRQKTWSEMLFVQKEGNYHSIVVFLARTRALLRRERTMNLLCH